MNQFDIPHMQLRDTDTIQREAARLRGQALRSAVLSVFSAITALYTGGEAPKHVVPAS